jgi:two-component system cell cycle sensor histidine kinase PleC
MSIPGEQLDLAALHPDTSSVKQRLAARHVREARGRLTSSSGTRPTFVHELLRQYAQNRISASLTILLLVATVGLMSSLWTGVFAAGTWTAAVLIIHAVMITKCRRFLERPMHEVSSSAWRVRLAEHAPSIAPEGKLDPSSDETRRLDGRPLFRAGT